MGGLSRCQLRIFVPGLQTRGAAVRVSIIAALVLTSRPLRLLQVPMWSSIMPSTTCSPLPARCEFVRSNCACQHHPHRSHMQDFWL